MNVQRKQRKITDSGNKKPIPKEEKAEIEKKSTKIVQKEQQNVKQQVPKPAKTEEKKPQSPKKEEKPQSKPKKEEKPQSKPKKEEKPQSKPKKEEKVDVEDDENEEEEDDEEEEVEEDEEEVEYEYVKNFKKPSNPSYQEEEADAVPKTEEPKIAEKPVATLFGRKDNSNKNKLKNSNVEEDEEEDEEVDTSSSKIPASTLTVKVLNVFPSLPIEVLNAALEQQGLPSVTDDKITDNNPKLCYFEKTSGYIQTKSQEAFQLFISKAKITFRIPTLDSEHTLVFLPSLPNLQKNALMVSDLAPEMNEKLLKNYVSELGTVKKMIFFEPIAQQRKKTCSAYVEFEEKELPESVLSHSGAEILGKLCNIEFYNPSIHNQVLISNLPQIEDSADRLTEQELKMYVEECGAVDYLYFQKNAGGAFNGVAILAFKSILGCKTIQEYSNSEIHGKPCPIVFLQNMKKRPTKIIKH